MNPHSLYIPVPVFWIVSALWLSPNLPLKFRQIKFSTLLENFFIGYYISNEKINFTQFFVIFGLG